MKTIYLDYASSTPLDPRVLEKMKAILHTDGIHANAASGHAAGKAAREHIEHARSQIAKLLHADTSEIIFTSGATESINLALKGATHLYHHRGKHIITMATEHRAVLAVCQHLEKEGYSVTYLSPMPDGLLDLDQLKQALRSDTVLISIMHVNNETGVIQDIASIAALTKSKEILLHVDAAQSVGKLPLNVLDVPVDFISLSAHKVYGPKGIGALFLRKKPRVRVSPLLHGGGHEQGMRSGTLPTHQIVGMGEAYALANIEREHDWQHAQLLRELLISKLNDRAYIIPKNNMHRCVPHIVNMAFENKLADASLSNVPHIALSTAAACQGFHTDGSYVLRKMGLSDDIINSAIRFSFGRFTNHHELTQALAAINEII